VIKVVAPALMHPGARTLAEFHNYWAQSHGPLFSQTKDLQRYVQHLTLPEAYGRDPAPTYDGVSMFWYSDLEALRTPSNLPEAIALREAVREDDRQLFDRLPGWPMSHKRASVVAEEHLIVDGETSPEMVKAIFIASKLPGLTLAEFFEHWRDVHGALAARVPGLRRYVQNHAIPEAYAFRGMTHDGWSELWFDSLEALHAAVASAEWGALREDGAQLFARPMGIGVARELVQKEIGTEPRPSEVADWKEDRIQRRLEDEGYASLAADPSVPCKIRAAALSGNLAVWTSEHLVTIDASRIDARPDT
jgi:uncharacterized protein (TIGR02118 family)